MKRLLLFTLSLLVAISAGAAQIKLLSPDTAQTYAVSWVVDHLFTWNARTGQFGAAVWFSDRSATKSRDEESFRFAFPEVKLDASNQTFYVVSETTQRLPIAQLRQNWLGQTIIPTPGTSVLIANEHGKVRLVLTANSALQQRGAFAPAWVERSDAWVFQNLLRDVAGVN